MTSTPRAGEAEDRRDADIGIKMLKSDPAQVQAQSEDIKARYAKLFWV